jgi:hypothetical protein
VKTPLPLLALAVVGAWPACAPRAMRAWTALVPLVGASRVLAVGMKSHVDLGIRCAVDLSLPRRARRTGTCSPGTRGNACVVGAPRSPSRCSSSRRSHPVSAWPDYLAYFNPVAGREPERVLVDSNLDWGQDLYRLADTVRARHIDSVRVHYFGSASLRAVGLPNARHLARNERTTGGSPRARPFSPASGRTPRSLARAPPPVARIGPSMRSTTSRPSRADRGPQTRRTDAAYGATASARHARHPRQPREQRVLRATTMRSESSCVWRSAVCWRDAFSSSAICGAAREIGVRCGLRQPREARAPAASSHAARTALRRESLDMRQDARAESRSTARAFAPGRATR